MILSAVFGGGGRRLIRRARGFAPQPVPLRVFGAVDPLGSADAGEISENNRNINQIGASDGTSRTKPVASIPRILAFGAQLKNTFCFCRDGRAYLSSHVGDLDDAETHAFCEREISSFLALFGGEPELLVHDLHPDYASTRMAQAYARAHPTKRILRVQHHRAHFASVLAEHALPSALGFIFDGSGYGDDGTSWGGELFLGSVSDARRIGHLRPLRLPGGDAAIREPWRVALWAVADACGDDTALRMFSAFPDASILLRLAQRGVRSPVSTGMGRLFDLFAVVAGLLPCVSYEGQAAIALEAVF